MYSTNLGMRHYAFEHLAKAIESVGSDEDLLESIEDFRKKALAQLDSEDIPLFKGEYGITSDGKKGSKAISLISKYCYFLYLSKKEQYPDGYPIFDSLAREMVGRLLKYLGVEQKLIKIETMSDHIRATARLYDALKKFYPSSTLQAFDLLDRLLWRLGKVSQGSLSLLIKQTSYEKVLENLKNTQQGIKTKEAIQKAIQQDYPIFKGIGEEEIMEALAQLTRDLQKTINSL